MLVSQLHSREICLHLNWLHCWRRKLPIVCELFHDPVRISDFRCRPVLVESAAQKSHGLQCTITVTLHSIDPHFPQLFRYTCARAVKLLSSGEKGMGR